MFNRSAYANTRPDGVAVLQVAPAAGEQEAPPRFVSLKRTVLRGEIVGPLAALRVTHVYGYTRAQCQQVIEALYRFPLPGDTAVTAVTVRFGEVEIRAELRDRKEAKAAYEQAKAEGKQAALTTRESPDVFTLHVAGIQPDEDVTVETSYVQLARAEGPGWALRVPLAVAPRYVRSDELASRHAHGQPLALLRDPGHRFVLDVMIGGPAAVHSSTHALATSLVEDGVRVQLADAEVIPDRDLVLAWQLPQGAHPALQVWWHDDRAAEQVYFLAAITPPALGPALQSLSREVLLLVDHSGSMRGAKWQAADWAVQRFLSDLTPDDALALCLFHNKTFWFKKVAEVASPSVVKEAIDFLLEQRSSGGTEMGVALEQALSVPPAPHVVGRQVLLITDAQVSDEARILRLADDERGRSDSRRINILCIDAAPNSFLALELAERGRGLARFVTSNPEEEDITTALDDVLADWAAPVAAGVTLEANRPSAQAAGRLVASLPEGVAIDCGDLPVGRSVWVTGRLPRGDGTPLRLRLAAQGQQALDEAAFEPGVAGDDYPAIKALFGARQVLALEFLTGSGRHMAGATEQLRRLGYDPAVELVTPSAPKVYAENTREDLMQALRGLLVREALHYGIASTETAFVAVRSERGMPVQVVLPVAGALPQGWSDDFLKGASLMRGMQFAAPPEFGMMSLHQHPSYRAAPEAMPEHDVASLTIAVLDGKPCLINGEAVLFDSERPADAGKWAGATLLAALRVRLPGHAPSALDPGIALWLFAGDLTAPRARVRLADITRLGGERPLHVAVGAGERVRLILVDPAGVWAQEAPRLQVELMTG